MSAGQSILGPTAVRLPGRGVSVCVFYYKATDTNN